MQLKSFAGINTSVTPTQINDNQSPDMLNFNVDERGALNKRTGYKKIFDTPIDNASITGLFEFRMNGINQMLIGCGDKFYRYENDKIILINESLSGDRLDMFYIGDKAYFLNGRDYFSYDGSVCKTVEPYIPTISMSKDPAGGGTALEDFNLLGSGFQDSFSADGVAKAFVLSLKNLDTTPIKVVVDAVEKVLTTDYTVDFETGIVTFIATPPKGTNNVVITAYKTQAGFPERIKKCRFSTLFGGTNDTRVFVSGNPDFPNQIWASELYNPTYFPENRFYKIGSERESVTGFSKQYDYLVIEKENSKGNMQYSLNTDGTASFPTKPLNDQIGTIATKSIQIVNNNPISLSRNGVYTIVQSNVRDERNVVHVSANVDSKLLKEADLSKAVSVEYDKKYWLALNGKVYIYDYAIGEWYIYDNIPADCFIVFNGELHFGSNGYVYRFMQEYEDLAYTDDGQPINAYWTSKYLSFDADHLLKTVDKVYFTMKPDSRTSAALYYTSNKKVSGLLKEKRNDQLDFLLFDFSFLSFVRSTFPQSEVVRVRAKKVTHFQLKIVNDKPEESLGILSIGIKYNYGSAVK